MRTQPTDQGGRWILATVQQLTRGSPNEFGERTEAWADVGQKWVRTLTLSAKERLRADADVVDDVSHILDMRWYDGLTSTDHRIVFEGRLFNITGLVDVDNLHRWWQLTCNEIGEQVAADPAGSGSGSGSGGGS